jgi:hypothetical protein
MEERVAQIEVLLYLGGEAAGGPNCRAKPPVASATPVGEYANRGHPRRRVGAIKYGNGDLASDQTRARYAAFTAE